MVLIVSRQQRHLRAFFVGENPVAVVLFFINPAGFMERLVHQCGQHRTHAKWNAILHKRLPITASPRVALSTFPPFAFAMSANKRFDTAERGFSAAISSADAYLSRCLI